MNAPRVDFPPFEPHIIVAGPRRMTYAGALKRRALASIATAGERRIVRVDGRTQVRVELNRPPRPTRSALVIQHGLVGSSESVYALGTAAKATEHGFLAARVNARNCGGTEALTTEAYNGGVTEDLEAVARELVRADGIERIHLVGFSVGANQVLRLAARLSSDPAGPPSWLASVVAVSPCIDFAASITCLESSLFGALAQRRFLGVLKTILRRRHALYPGTIDLGAIDRIRSVRSFDDRYTAPLSGFRDAHDYYSSVSMRTHLDPIAVATLLLTSRDDPLVPIAPFEPLEHGRAPIQLVITERGGHVAFIGRRPARNAHWHDSDRRWAENRAVQFAAAHDAR